MSDASALFGFGLFVGRAAPPFLGVLAKLHDESVKSWPFILHVLRALLFFFFYSTSLMQNIGSEKLRIIPKNDETNQTGSSKSNNSFKLLIKESLLIAKDRPILNKAISSTELLLF